MTRQLAPYQADLTQFRVAMGALGVEPDLLHELHFVDGAFTVTHVRKDLKGRYYVAGQEVATTTSTFGVRNLTRAEKRARARDRVRRARWSR